MHLVHLCVAAILAVSCVSAAAAEPIVLPLPEGAGGNRAFAVSVRRPGGAWKDVPCYDVRVDLHTLSHAAFATVSMDSPIEVRIERTATATAAWTIRPLAARIATRREGQAVIFALDTPRDLVIEADGDRLHALHLLASLPDLPPAAGPGVISFGPGLHRLGSHPAIVAAPGGNGRQRAVIPVPSGTTVHLAEGAVVQAAIVAERGARDIRICGRGVIDLAPWNEADGRFRKGVTWQTPGISLPDVRGARIEGVVVRQATGYAVMAGGASDIVIDRLRAFSSHQWADGIDMMSTSKVRITRCFLRTSDDCIAVYGSRFGYQGDARDWEVSDSVLWADVAHPIYVGVHGDWQGQGDTIAGLRFHDIDVLENDEASEGFWGALSIGCGDRNVCRDIVFERIRVEHIRDAGGRLIDVQFKFYEPSTVAGKAISGLVFRDISYDGPHASLIAGSSAGQAVTDVLIENLRLGGRVATDAGQARLTIGPHATGVRVVQAP